jgi:hypothetical protein
LAHNFDAIDTSRHFAAPHQFGRYRSEADVQRAVIAESDS